MFKPKLTAVVALSRHRTLATFDGDLTAAALDPSSYVYCSTQAVNLPVTGASRASNNQAYVLTGPQEPVNYEVRSPKTPQSVTFTGSTATEPKLVTARAVSKTQIILTFSEPLATSALQPSFYQITVQGSSTVLTVNSAGFFGSTQTEVLLTTAPQEAVPYVLKIGDLQGASGTYMDPTANTLQFTGSTVLPGPMLLNATADGNTRVILTFDVPLDPASATNVANYVATPDLFIQSATLQSENRQVVLTTGPQYGVEYSIVANVTGADGNPVNPSFNSVKFTGSGEAISTERPKVVSAGSAGNTSVVVQFSKPMADNATDPSHYAIVQTVVHPEVGNLPVTAAAFVDSYRLSVRLTTLSQAEVTYQVTANNVTDLIGNPLADKTNEAGVLVDPTSATFPGTPPTGDERVDSDNDGLYDHEEIRGWEIVIKLANGETQVRQITSSPYTGDTDLDGVMDRDERALNIDPRDDDTDDDSIGDEPEFNVYYSDPANQDSDGDGLFDGLETSFFLTSPLFDDTDGDQLKDGYEINVNRNPKVADLPQPVLKVGETRMGLDVRFIESNGQTTRQLDAKSVEATLVQSASQEYSSSEAATHEASTTLSQKAGIDAGYAESSAVFVVSYEASHETSNTNSYTSEFTQSSSTATEQAHTSSLTTEVEAALDSTVTREIVAANLQLAVTLESKGNVGFTATNLQVAAMIQDPFDPTRLTPIATLVPETGLETSFTLGPLVPPKGPIVFSSTNVYPQLIDELMNNPRGLVFRFANYDIVDETGRNFAFTSQEVNDRTARIAIDYGGFDPDGDGRGKESEILRVATGIIGRVVDTNGDGQVDGADRKVVFDPSGQQVGITLRDGLAVAGLKAYDESINPSHTLSLADKQGSYSTIKSADGREILFRVRDRQVQPGSRKSWEIVGRTGIDRMLNLDERILHPGTNVTLMFLEDVDGDRLPALTEAIHGCSESLSDSDGDGLDDRFEVLVGWEVKNPLGTREVRPKCNWADSDGDGLGDRQEAPGILYYDTDGLVLFEAELSGLAPSRSISDLATTSGSAIVTSSSANFTAQDVGMLMAGSAGGPIPASCVRILSVQSPTQATLTANATTTASGVSASIGSPYTQNCNPHREGSPWPRTVSDLATTQDAAVITSASAKFAAADVGKPISGSTAGSPIPNGSFILSVESETNATMSTIATATASAVSAVIGSDADAAIADPVTDPASMDTDLDGLSDNFELIPYKNALELPMRQTSPEHPDSERDGLTDGVERQLGGDPRVDDNDLFTDSDRDGLTDAQEVADDNNDFVIDEAERGNAGWDVTVNRMHLPLNSPEDRNSAVAVIADNFTAARVHHVHDAENLRVGMIVEIKDEVLKTEPPLITSVDAIEWSPIVNGVAVVTFGAAFNGVSQRVYSAVCKNGTCPAQNVTDVVGVYSSKYNADTDGDGLSDYEESRLGTDPGCRLRPNASGQMVLDCKPNQTSRDLDGDGVSDGWDTDGDGLTDFQEVRGFKLVDATTVKTKPTYVDTDNDRRSDGHEAGLPGGEFIVRLPGGNFYQAHSHPLKADTDFDYMVDGDEQTFGIDPTKPNTDGDNLSDYSEVFAGRRPEVPDMHVTMNLVRLSILKDGEKDGDGGDFQFEFYAVLKNGSSQLVVHSERNDEGALRLPLEGLHPEYGTTLGNCPGDNWNDQCWHLTKNDTHTIVRIHDQSGVPFTPDGSGREVVIGSVSTTDAVPEQFGIKGYVAEYDGGDNDQLACKYEIYPDIFGDATDGTGLVKGSQLRLGTNSMAIHRNGASCGDEEVDFTLMVSYTAS